MTPRAIWKETLKVAEVFCSVALYTAASGSECIAFHTINRPDDERYLSLDDLWASVKGRSERSHSRVLQTANSGPRQRRAAVLGVAGCRI